MLAPTAHKVDGCPRGKCRGRRTSESQRRQRSLERTAASPGSVTTRSNELRTRKQQERWRKQARVIGQIRHTALVRHSRPDHLEGLRNRLFCARGTEHLTRSPFQQTTQRAISESAAACAAVSLSFTCQFLERHRVARPIHSLSISTSKNQHF